MIKLFFILPFLIVCHIFCKRPETAPAKNMANDMQKVAPAYKHADIGFNSFIDLIDSIANQNTAPITKQKVVQCKTKENIVEVEGGVEERNAILINNYNIEKINRFWGATKPDYRGIYDSCSAKYYINGHFVPIDNLDCISTIIYLDVTYVELNDQAYIWGRSIPEFSLIAPPRHQMTYTLFNLCNHDCFNAYYAVFPLYLIGLKTGDFNKDLILDFLMIENDFTQDDLKYIDGHFKNQEAFYKITLLSNINGKWVNLKDRSGNPYFMLIQLDKIFDENSPGKIVSLNWP
jgi:hypothetical protein